MGLMPAAIRATAIHGAKSSSLKRRTRTGSAVDRMPELAWPGITGDGAAATSLQLNGPSGIAIDAQGNFFISDNESTYPQSRGDGIGDPHRRWYRNLWFWDGRSGDIGDAQESGPIAVDGAGNIYFIDNGQCSGVRKDFFTCGR